MWNGLLNWFMNNTTGEHSVVNGYTKAMWTGQTTLQLAKTMEQAAKEAGFSLMMENANQKQENQIAAIRRFIAYKVDVIAFSPIVEDGWDNVLEEAKAAGIPVILVDRDISTEKKV